MHFPLFFMVLFLVEKGHSTECFVSGECINSPLISSSLQNNANNCLKECQEEENCAWFSYDSPIKLCMFLANCTGRVTRIFHNSRKLSQKHI